ncbi:MAG TPA: TolC family protein, partial [Balneolaceae bacterium]|nr:TolC family protein [Balneolaceae bacterium]
KVKYGTATHFNLIRAQVDFSNAQTQKISAKNDLEQAKATFFNTLGVSQNSQVMLDDSLDYQPVNTNEGKAIHKALLNRPDLASSKLNVELQKSSLKSTYSRYLPTVSAYFDQTWANPAPLTIPPSQSWGYLWNAGFRLNWSIFNLDREGSIMQERSTLRQQQLDFLDTQQQVIYDVHSAEMALQNAKQSVDAQKLTVQQATEGLKLAQAQFKQGTIDQVSLLEARQALSEAELSYYSSLYQHKVARLDLLRATGQLQMNFSNKADSNK